MGARENLAELSRAQKPAVGTPAYSRWVNRPLARLLTAWAHETGMSPNVATAISAAHSGTAVLLIALARPTPLLGVLVGLLLVLGYLWDSVDGQLARLTGRGSPRGEWLDHTVDCAKTVTLHLAVLVNFYRHPADTISLAIPLIFTIAATVLYFGLIVTPFLRRTSPPGPTPPAEHPLRPWMLLPGDYGALCVVFVAFGYRPLFSVLYGVCAFATVGLLALAWRKWWHELEGPSR